MAAISKNRRLERVSSAGKRAMRVRTRGQAIVIVALMLTVLMLFIGLGVDVGNMMARRAKLQSAVDSAVLSAAQTLGGNVVTQTTIVKANQILEASGIPSNTLNMARTTVDFPAQDQVHMKATQRIDTFFMRLIPLWKTVEISAEATADLNSYAEINTKPFGKPGVVSELNLMVWGKDSSRTGGDAYSPEHMGNGDTSINPWHSQMPYGYLYRIDVPPNYPSDYLSVEIFDPDTYNRSDLPPAWPTPYVCPGVNCGRATPTPSADQYASCTNPNPGGGDCTSNNARYNNGLKLLAFPPYGGNASRPAFWRVDEVRYPYTQAIAGSYADAYLTQTKYTIWHFDPHITSAFGNPSTLSDQTGGAYVAQYTGLTGSAGSATDLKWFQPPNFKIHLTDDDGDLFTRESNDSMYFYLYVQGLAGSSENNFDLRVGPPDLNDGGCATPCYVNEQYRDPANNPDWYDGGATILAKRALPLNLDTGPNFPLAFTQVSKNAAGQTLGVRHFDQDCTGGCGSSSSMIYEMQSCLDPSTWIPVGVGYTGPGNEWRYTSSSPYVNNPDPEPVQIPIEGSSNYNSVFGVDGSCATSWLRLRSDPSYSQDTTVWEMPFIRPRLIK